jgi:hypothetical protein
LIVSDGRPRRRRLRLGAERAIDAGADGVDGVEGAKHDVEQAVHEHARGFPRLRRGDKARWPRVRARAATKLPLLPTLWLGLRRVRAVVFAIVRVPRFLSLEPR